MNGLFIKHKKTAVFFIATAALAALFPAHVLAGVSDAATLFSQGGKQASGAQNGFLQVAGFVGLIMFAVSGVKLFNSRESGNDGKGKLWSALAAGVFLMGLWTFAAIVSNTATGQTKSADEMKSIVTGGGQ